MMRKVWTGFIWLRTGISMGSGEHHNEPPGYIKDAGFLYSFEQILG
jgi:hypothetical protein